MNKWAARGAALGLWALFIVVFGLIGLPVARNVQLGIGAVWHLAVGAIAVIPSDDLKLPGRIGMAVLIGLLSFATGLVGAAMLLG